MKQIFLLFLMKYVYIFLKHFCELKTTLKIARGKEIYTVIYVNLF